ncbi:uncharacterized protein PADG_11347 [Paracoccidioides brasiliensis Pb18]|uniref:RRM domain-containing protein n=1 Tax=Paracoccidioides brasiliensis (strain Pb18) TaxID=502780 RepID=A0A0A0HYS7_PARBD|nr:uncharacterized protein PADG_11347 [Paracoccidioides brasiliensis Pb18]KGM92520.1 hypothetical protein PADG_11347 [Paracoccidioides brasiliensis Pb18]
MAENAPPTTSSTLPPPPQPSAGAPGQQQQQQQQFDGSQGSNNSQGGNPSHMPPPPLAPVVIPQNTNPIPTAITSPNVRQYDVTYFRRWLCASCGSGTKQARPIFETTGHVQSVKIIPDKNSKGLNYGFVEYDDPGAAERAMATLNGRRVHQSEIRVNWAYQSNSNNKEDTSNHFHIFVGDLSNEVNDEVLLQAFSAFGSVSEARVMWDMKTGRSRGYGFVAFRERSDAEKALSSMDGEWLGSRAIRCNWANQKGQPSISQQQAMAAMGMTPTTPFGHHHFPTHGVQSYDMVVAQTPQWQTTCYVGNLTPYTTQNDLVPLFQNFGYVVETRFQADRGFAFVKMDTHENAAMAICQLSGYNVNGRPLKCSWGKDRPPTGQFEGYSPQQQQQQAGTPTFNSNTSPYFPQYSGPSGPMTPQGGAVPSPSSRGWDQQSAPFGGPGGQGGYGGHGRGGQGGQGQAGWGGQPGGPNGGVVGGGGVGVGVGGGGGFGNGFGGYQG